MGHCWLRTLQNFDLKLLQRSSWDYYRIRCHWQRLIRQRSPMDAWNRKVTKHVSDHNVDSQMQVSVKFLWVTSAIWMRLGKWAMKKDLSLQSTMRSLSLKLRLKTRSMLRRHSSQCLMKSSETFRIKQAPLEMGQETTNLSLVLAFCYPKTLILRKQQNPRLTKVGKRKELHVASENAQYSLKYKSMNNAFLCK